MLLAANDEKQRNEIGRTKLLYTPLDLPSYDDRAMNDKFTIKMTMNAETSLLQHKSNTADDISASHHGKKKSSQSSKPPSLQPMRRNKHPLKLLREKSIPEKNQDNTNSSYATRNYSKEKTKDACYCVETSSSPVRNQPLLHTIESATKNSTVNVEPMYKVLAVSSSSSYSSKSRVAQQNKTSQPSATLLDGKLPLESGRTVVVLASNGRADNSNIIRGPALTDSPTGKSARMIVRVEPRRERVKVVPSRHADNDDDDDRNGNEITAPRMMMNASMSMASTGTAFPTRGGNELHNRHINSLDEGEKKMTFAGDGRIVNQQPQQSAMMSIDNYMMITNNDKEVQQEPKTLLTCLSSSSSSCTRTTPYEQKLVEVGSFEYNLQSLMNELSDIRHIFELIQSKTI
jgi:hypothetical protein